MADEYLTVAETAQLLKINPQTIRNWIDRGELPAVRVGQRRVRIRQTDLDAFLAAETPQPDEPPAGTPEPAIAQLRQRLRTALTDSTASLDRQDTAQLARTLDSLATAAADLAAALRHDAST